MIQYPTHSGLLGRLTVLIVFGALLASAASAGEHRIGFGMHYFKSIDDLDSDLDEDGLVPVFSYQYRPAGLFFLEADLEYHEDGFGGSAGTAYSPQVFLMFGFGFYGGVGVGVTYADDFEDNVSDLYYLARAGWSFKVLPRISLDLNANYAAESFSNLNSANTDSITLGASVRVSL